MKTKTFIEMHADNMRTHLCFQCQIFPAPECVHIWCSAFNAFLQGLLPLKSIDVACQIQKQLHQMSPPEGKNLGHRATASWYSIL